MHGLRLRWRRGATGANRPNRFVRDHHGAHVVDALQRRLELTSGTCEQKPAPKGDTDDLNDLAGASCPKNMLKICEQMQVAINKGREAALPKKAPPPPAPAPAAPAKPAT